MTGLPPFSAIHPEHVEAAIDTLLADNRAAIAQLLVGGGPYTWANLMQPLEDIEERLSRVWSPVSHMNAVVNSPELRVAYNACLPKLSDYATEMGQNEALFQAIKAIADGAEYPRLDIAQKKIIDNALRLPPVRRRPATGTQGALQGHHAGAVQSHRALRRKPARRHQCLVETDQ
jgi:oligopeptidase A